MKQKIAVTLDHDLVSFLDEQARGNRSEYLNALLVQKRQQTLEVEMIAALQQDNEDFAYQSEVAAWDAVAGDGLDAEG
ncbi:Prevent host death protein, Phd antitoxin [uncultured Synechococcales cyanobacterium]|uniref:Prevent host death protein, Phd antitoxin n=1 Tax=uncultured Synechococcales cyanobacterium TaxID=1936017 RepID=A0A6J4VF52_9CYAN|nr:Prevent host death protein, Phd antitoxin [uncultured Synechococcales cyanobacterium]